MYKLFSICIIVTNFAASLSLAHPHSPRSHERIMKSGEKNPPNDSSKMPLLLSSLFDKRQKSREKMATHKYSQYAIKRNNVGMKESVVVCVLDVRMCMYLHRFSSHLIFCKMPNNTRSDALLRVHNTYPYAVSPYYCSVSAIWQQ